MGTPSIAVLSARRRRRNTGGAAAVTLLSDTFNRADNAASLGSTDGGTLSPVAWVAEGGTFGISTNRGASFVAAYHAASVATGAADVTVQATLAIVDAAGGLGIAARITDDNNFLYLEGGGGFAYTLFKRSAGSFVSLGNFPTTPTNGDVIKLVCSGASLQAYVNGVLRISVTDAFNSTAVKHGLATNVTTGRFDNFSVTTP